MCPFELPDIFWVVPRAFDQPASIVVCIKRLMAEPENVKMTDVADSNGFEKLPICSILARFGDDLFEWIDVLWSEKILAASEFKEGNPDKSCVTST